MNSDFQFFEKTIEITDDIIKQINTFSESIINYLSDRNNVTYELFEENIYNIISLIYNNKENIITIDTIKLLCHAFQKIKYIINCKVDLWESDGLKQMKNTYSMSDLLIFMLQNSYHTYVGRCKSFKNGKCEFDHPFIDSHNHIFSCRPYHTYDSVATHSILVSLCNMIYCIFSKYSEHTIFLAGFAGLFHDIGKLIVIETLELKKKLFTMFSSHAEFGAIQFMSLWSDEMSKFITKQEFIDIGTVILRHMCGYHGNADITSAYKRDMFLIENSQVLLLLTINRVGDHFGRLPSKLKLNNNNNNNNNNDNDNDNNNNDNNIDNDNDIEHFFEEQKKFENKVLSKEKFNLNNIVQKYTTKNGARISADKLVIYLIGRSGAGKTYFTKSFVKKFPQTTVVSRDECIAQVCVGTSERLEGLHYEYMYNIYEASKNYNAILRKKNNKLIRESMMNIATAQTKWNEFISNVNNNPNGKFKEIALFDMNSPMNIQEEVATLYNKKIIDATKDINKIMVIDSFMNCFPHAVKVAVPDIIKQYFRIHIHIISYDEMKYSTISDNIDNQLQVSGAYGLYTPMHPNGFCRNKKQFSSLSSERQIDGDLPVTAVKSNYRPHLVSICIRTSNMNIGYDDTFDLISKCIS